MILIDECITSKLKKYLKKKGLANIIAVSEEETLKGKPDEYLLGLGIFNNAVLITKDREFFELYPGKAIYYNRKLSWFDIYQKIISCLNT